MTCWRCAAPGVRVPPPRWHKPWQQQVSPAAARIRRIGSSPPLPAAQAEQLTLEAPIAHRGFCVPTAPRARALRQEPPVAPVGPFPADEALVPGQQSTRSQGPVQPQVPGQQPCQGRDRHYRSKLSRLLWAAGSLSRLCGAVVLVDRAAEHFLALYQCVQWHDGRLVVIGWPLVPGLVRPVPVVMVGVGLQDRPQMCCAVDQHPVGASQAEHPDHDQVQQTDRHVPRSCRNPSIPPNRPGFRASPGATG